MKYLRRIVWFFATRLLALCVILGLMILAVLASVILYLSAIL